MLAEAIHRHGATDLDVGADPEPLRKLIERSGHLGRSRPVDRQPPALRPGQLPGPEEDVEILDGEDPSEVSGSARGPRRPSARRVGRRDDPQRHEHRPAARKERGQLLPLQRRSYMERVGSYQTAPQPPLPDGPLPPRALPQRLLSQHPVRRDDERRATVDRRRRRRQHRRYPDAVHMDHEEAPLGTGHRGRGLHHGPDPPRGLPLAPRMPRRGDRGDCHPGTTACSADHRAEPTGMLARDADRHPDPSQPLRQLPDTDRHTAVLIERARDEEDSRQGIGHGRDRQAHGLALLTLLAEGRGASGALSGQHPPEKPRLFWCGLEWKKARLSFP